MDALMAALIAGVLASIGDKPAWLAAILADRFRAPLTVVAGAALAFALLAGAAAMVGAWLGPRFTPEAKLLMLSCALVLEAGGGWWGSKRPDALAGWRLPAIVTSFLGLFVLAFGEGLQFIVVTIAARTAVPILAAVGAVLGAVAVIGAAALLGEAGWTALPLARVRRGVAALFVVAALMFALQALRLV